MKRLSNYVTKEQGAELKENYVKTFGNEAWERLQERAAYLKSIEKDNRR